MFFGSNLQYLRKQHGCMTQEKLAERMNVSRQTISKWESDEALPDVAKLIDLCGIFSCKLDELLREDMTARDDIYSPVRIEHVKGFRMARYVIISPNPEDNANDYMLGWAQKSGLMDIPGFVPRFIGWDFPFVSPEQRNRFNLRGYAVACILPDDFEPRCGGAEIACQEDADYAVITIREPFIAPFERIPHAYQLLLEHLNRCDFKQNAHADCISCFEEIVHENGTEFMNVYILASRPSA